MKAETLNQAIEYHRAGRLQEACEIYERILEGDPNHADALHLRGLIAHEHEEYDLAVELIRKAVKKDPQSPFYYSNLAMVFLKLGKTGEAIACCEMGLELDPKMAESHCQMGNAYKAQGQLSEAIIYYRKALRLKPQWIEPHDALGSIYLNQGNLEKAIRCYQSTVKIKPDDASTWYNMAVIFAQQRKYQEAERCYLKTIQHEPRHFKAHVHLGILNRLHGHLEEAVSFQEKAVALEPENPNAWNNLGMTLRMRDETANAQRCFEKAVSLKPDWLEPYTHLFRIFRHREDIGNALSCYQKVMQMAPEYPKLHFDMGELFRKQGKLNEAASCYQRATQTDPNGFLAFNNLGIIFQEYGRLSQAVSHFKKAIEIKPDYAPAHNNLGNAYSFQLDFNQTIECYDKAVEIDPNYVQARSNSLMAALYEPAVGEKELYEKARNYWKWLSSKKIEPFTHEKKSFKGRRIRIGYVSPDFRRHSVSYFFLPLLRAHNRNKFEIFCYAEVPRPDSVTKEIEYLSDGWRKTIGMSDEVLARQIKDDGIDILVDLAGHTAGNRLLVFAYKPAPVQVTWLGYPATTGVPAIDYRLTDAIADPPGEADKYHTETLIRLPHGFLSYEPPNDSPPVSRPPFLETGIVTFGSFNNTKKMNSRVIRVWASILKQVPKSRLLLQSIVFSDTAVKERFLDFFGKERIASKRIQFAGFIPSQRDHLELHNQVDIALDPFPYNGTTTTYETLWMGVPVITLKGNRHSGRVGAAILKKIGMEDLIASNSDEYVSKAIQIALNIDRLDALRHKMRLFMKEAHLCNTRLLACDMQQAFGQMESLSQARADTDGF